ncbi:non-viral RNA polymerase beta-prime subunit [Staphylococcus phage vB_StaM_PB50]|nr:non-viral RNA polymerase beta-prime subunit [Staphylococcus phage vB_StaM_PB50]
MSKYLSKVTKNINEDISKKEPFNEDVIYFRQNESLEKIISDIYRSVEFIKGIKFLDCKVVSPSQVYEYNQMTDKQLKSKDYRKINVEESKLLEVQITVEFEDSEGNKEEYTHKLDFPELIEGQYYYINNNKFFPILQLADAEFYKPKASTVVMKNLLQPLSVNGSKKDTIMDDDNKMSNFQRGRTLYLEVFNKNKSVPAFMFFVAKMGFDETFEFLEIKDHCEVIDINDDKEDNYYYFKINNKLSLKVEKEWLDVDDRYRNSMILCIKDLFKGMRAGLDKIYDREFWLKALGSIFSGSTNIDTKIDKANSMILSFDRILDSRTQAISRLEKEDKESTYHVVKYMFKNFDNLNLLDNTDLANKRLRVLEYLTYPLNRKNSDTSYRMINFSDKKRTIKNLKGLFSGVPRDYLLKTIGTSDGIRYSNAVNTIDLFTRILKMTKAGPQSAVDTSKPSIRTININNTYFGRIDLIATSSNNPGITRTLTPFCEVKDPGENGSFYFENKPNIKEIEDIENIDKLEKENDDQEVIMDIKEIVEEGED